mmetsp:Transcript_4630/g.11528  ORF Transcript_4630/g.11528 Transcript_4630/m.11528 type:complete len:244 (+) Transcript_4630:768-1499(+)
MPARSPPLPRDDRSAPLSLRDLASPLWSSSKSSSSSTPKESRSCSVLLRFNSAGDSADDADARRLSSAETGTDGAGGSSAASSINDAAALSVIGDGLTGEVTLLATGDGARGATSDSSDSGYSSSLSTRSRHAANASYKIRAFVDCQTRITLSFCSVTPESSTRNASKSPDVLPSFALSTLSSSLDTSTSILLRAATAAASRARHSRSRRDFRCSTNAASCRRSSFRSSDLRTSARFEGPRPA